MNIKRLINIFFVFAVCQMNYLAAAKIALVSNFGGSSVTLIDTTTDMPLLDVSTGARPLGIAITPNGEKAYVANYDDNTVTVINLTTSPPTTTTLNDPSFQFNTPVLIAITPDGLRAYVSNINENSVTVINTADDTWMTTLSGPFDTPVGIAITPDGQTALVANLHNVVKIDLATNAWSQITSADFNAGQDVAVKPDGSTAYVTNFNSATIVPIDLTTFVAGAAIDSPSGALFIAINPSGTKAYVTTYNAIMSVIDLVNNTLSNTISGLSRTTGIAFIPDGKKAYVTDFDSGNGYPILVKDDSLGSPITGFLNPYFVAVIPDQAPTASFTFTAEPSSYATLFDASASSSPDGVIENYAWDFGDGNTLATTSPLISHVYMTAGSFTVTLTVTNSQGTSTFQTFTGKTVSNNGGPTAVISQLINIISSTPTVTHVNPNFGPLAGGNAVTITGTNFINVTAVNFGLTNALSFIVNSPTSLTAIVPPGTVGIVDVSVTTLTGTSLITANDQYTYQNPAPTPPLPPSNFIGIIKKNKFLNRTECVLKAKWEASPSTNVAFYRIYKKGIVVEEVPATSPLVFKTCLKHCCGKGFEVAAVSSDNLESSHLKIQIVHK